MASAKKELDPELVQRIQEAGAAALNEVISKSVLDLVMNATEADLQGPKEAAEVAKGNAKPASAWCHAPGTIELLAMSRKRLVKTAEWKGMPVKEVTKVHAKVIGTSKVLHLRPADEYDRTAYDVHRYGRSSVAVNLFELLGSHGLLTETGYRERFDVFYVPRESPLWPGLLIDLGDVKERAKETRGKRKGGAPDERQDPAPDEEENS